MASCGGGGGLKRDRREDDDDDKGETSCRNKRPSSGAYYMGAGGDAQTTADDDSAAGEADYVYEYDDDYEYEEEESAAEQPKGDAASARDTEPRYAVLTEGDVRARQEADTARVAEVLSIPAGFACALLRHFKWRVGRAQEEWFSDAQHQQRVRGAVGLVPAARPDGDGDDELALQVPAARSQRPRVCGICFDAFPAGGTRSAGCAHYYCDGCWRGYVAAAVGDGARCLALQCPDPACAAAVVRELVDEVAGAADRARYARFWLRSYVEESGGRIRWCGGAGCTRSVELFGGCDAEAAVDVVCGCRHAFCWRCSEEAHRPVSCGTVRAWLAKNASDSETANWVVANTKRCPRCRRPIEKNHGCNHMTCGAPCRHQFCWLCLDPWDHHRGCTRYDYRRRGSGSSAVAQSTAGRLTGGIPRRRRVRAVDCRGSQSRRRHGVDEEEEQARRTQAEASLDRYLYHYERWVGNGKSLRKALADADELERSGLQRMARLVGLRAMELAFVTEAYRQIADGRRVLRWTHAYDYFLSLAPERDAAKRGLFDDLQSQANRWLECLHGCAELERKHLFGADAEPTVAAEAFRAYKGKLANLTGVTRKFIGNFVEAFKTNLPEVVVTPTRKQILCSTSGDVAPRRSHCARARARPRPARPRPAPHAATPASFGSNTRTAWDNSDTAAASSCQPDSTGMDQQAGIVSAMNLTIGLHPNAQQPPPKYVKIWEGTLYGQRQGQPVFISKLESWGGTVSRKVAADWPETMQIVRLIAQEHMNKKQYAGKADFLIFRTLNQHGFLGQLQEKKLCAVIQLPSQTLLLSTSDKAGRMVGMLFPKTRGLNAAITSAAGKATTAGRTSTPPTTTVATEKHTSSSTTTHTEAADASNAAAAAATTHAGLNSESAFAATEATTTATSTPRAATFTATDAATNTAAAATTTTTSIPATATNAASAASVATNTTTEASDGGYRIRQ